MREASPKVNLQVRDRDLKYYIFDWDDNILHMPTRIHVEKKMPDGTWAPHTVSTAIFSMIRDDTANYRPPNGKWADAFVEFQDYASETENSFLRDARRAIERVISGQEKPAPSFGTFRKTLVEGRLFAIVTARGHASQTLEKGVRLFIDLVLTPDEREEMLANLRGYRACFDGTAIFGSDEDERNHYLQLNHYHAVTSPGFKKRLAREAPGAEAPEAAKQFAIRAFVEHITQVLAHTRQDAPRRASISVGFSDDDPGNLAAAERFIHSELAQHFPGVKFCVYDTSDSTVEKGRKKIVSGQMELDL